MLAALLHSEVSSASQLSLAHYITKSGEVLRGEPVAENQLFAVLWELRLEALKSFEVQAEVKKSYEGFAQVEQEYLQNLEREERKFIAENARKLQ